MSLPGIRNKIKDGGLGMTGLAAAGVWAAVGVAASSSDIPLIITDYKKVKDKVGAGPLTDFLISTLRISKTTVYALPVKGSIPGTVSSIDDKGNTGTGSISITGSPHNDYNIEIAVITAGGLNAGSFIYTVDGFSSEEITIPDSPGQFTIPETGLTITFAAGDYEPGDIFDFYTTAPEASNADLISGVEKILSSKYRYEAVFIPGITAAPFWAAFSLILENVTERGKYIFGVCQVRPPEEGEDIDAYIAALIGPERGTVFSKRLAVCAGWIEEVNEKGYTDRRPMIGAFGGVLAARKPQQPVDATEYEALPGVENILPPGLDDSRIELLKSAGYVTLRYYEEAVGVWITTACLMSAEGSDYNTVEKIRVMNKACVEVRKAQFRYLNNNEFVDGSQDGINFFRQVSENPLEQMTADKEIVGFEVTIPEEQDILATEKIDTVIRIIPKGKISYIENTISYYNPRSKKETA